MDRTIIISHFGGTNNIFADCIIKYQWHIFVWPLYFYFYLLFTVAICISIFSHKWTRLVWHKSEDYFSITLSSDKRLEIWVCGFFNEKYIYCIQFVFCVFELYLNIFYQKKGFNRITNTTIQILLNFVSLYIDVIIMK